MELVASLLFLLVPIIAIGALVLVVIRRRRTRPEQGSAQGTYRNPALLTAFGWVTAILGAFTLLVGLPTLWDSSVPAETEMVIAATSMLVIGVVWGFVYGRRWITVWGEKVEYQPFFAGKRTIWAMDVIDIREESATLYIKRRDGKAASWYRSVFPPRTVSALRHGVHHNSVEANTRRTPVLGMDPFTVDETLEMPDGTTATWHGDRTVQLDILVSSPDEDLLRAVEDELANTFTSIPHDPRTNALPGSRSTSAGNGGSIEGARIEWHRRTGKSAIDAQVLATGENGLRDARRAYRWLRNQLIEGVPEVSHGANAGDRRRSRLGTQDAFIVTYRESWN